MKRMTYRLDNEPQNNGGVPPEDLAGYPDTARLVKGYRESAAEAKRWKEGYELLSTRIGQLEASMAGQRQDIPQRPSNPLDRLGDVGLPVDAFRDAVRQEFTQLFQPIAAGLQARPVLMSEYPDYSQFESQVAQFVQSDPMLSQRYQQMFQADPIGAMEFAFLKYGEHRRREQPTPNEPDPTAAQIPTQRSGDSRNPGNAEADNLQRAWEHYQKTGDPQPYARLRLRQSIPDSFYTG